ncbi:alpha/beta hydrolase [Roseovarius sp. EL26]|uniref:alpha/beta hydrolase n=1 Tax=Roseovarius sp. EL26 TaxID=2126672 RepID=UPI0013C415EA|nr:alpha/beta hydrolase [Roseovarius sp. EL26]
MKPLSKISPEALNILAQPPVAPIQRSTENLPHLRANTKAYITPFVEQALKDTGVAIQNITISGVPCLEITPAKQTVDWQILYGFGGGFVQGSPFEDLTISAHLCTMTGAKIIAPAYRLAPEHPWPAAIDDGFEVYRHMATHPFAIVGESAGGNFALSLMLRAQSKGLPLPRCTGLLSPWCDLSNSGDSLTANDGRDPTLTAQDVRSAAQHYASGQNLEDPAISPINGDFNAGFPPCIITSGTRDLLLSQAVCLAQTLRGHAVHVDLQVWEGLWHVFEWDNRVPEARRSLHNIAAFLSAHMKH